MKFSKFIFENVHPFQAEQFAPGSHNSKTHFGKGEQTML